MKLTQPLKEALRQIAAVDGTWTITMAESYYQAARKLEKLGLVEFKPRYVKRGKFRGQPNGYVVIATTVGKALL